MNKAIYLTVLLLMICQVAMADKVLDGVPGYQEMDGFRYIPMEALVRYGSGEVKFGALGQINCTVWGRSFKLKAGSQNLSVDGNLQNLTWKSAILDDKIYVTTDLPGRIGLWYRPTPTGLVIWKEGSETELLISRDRSIIRPRKTTMKGHVGVWYTPFWQAHDLAGLWKTAVGRKKEMPSRGKYACDDPAVMEEQYQQMLECGIDFMVFDDTNGVTIDDRSIDRIILAWLEFMDKKPVDRRIGISVCVGAELSGPDTPEQRASWTQAVDFVWNSYTNHPSYLRDNGKPVFFWFYYSEAWSDWSDSRWSIRRTYSYPLHDRIVRNGGWAYGCGPHAGIGSQCGSLSTGHDGDYDREGGARYQRLWCEVLSAHPANVWLSGWNGWNEGDAIEDSDGWKDVFGDSAPSWYRQFTQGYVAAYQGELVDDFYYRDESLPMVYRLMWGQLIPQGSYPHGRVTIVLPHGMLASLYGKSLP